MDARARRSGILLVALALGTAAAEVIVARPLQARIGRFERIAAALAVDDASADGWCCARGELLRAPAERCAAVQGRYFEDREPAERYCRREGPLPPPPPREEGWCCARGELLPAPAERCGAMRGRFFLQREEALRMCAERPPAALPDLAIWDVSVSPLEPRVGDEVRLEAIVRNTGVIPAREALVLFRMGGVAQRVTVGPVGEGGRTVAVTAICSAGEQIASAEVDPENRVAERNEENNRAAKLVAVRDEREEPPVVKVRETPGRALGTGSRGRPPETWPHREPDPRWGKPVTKLSGTYEIEPNQEREAVLEVDQTGWLAVDIRSYGEPGKVQAGLHAPGQTGPVWASNGGVSYGRLTTANAVIDVSQALLAQGKGWTLRLRNNSQEPATVEVIVAGPQR